MRRAPERTSPSKLLAAFLFLVVSGWIAITGLTKMRPPTPKTPVQTIRPEELADEPVPAEKKKKPEDLLVRFGSFAPGAKVLDRFTREATAERKPEPPEVEPKPEPKTEPDPKPEPKPDEQPGGKPKEEDKVPEHDVTLILLTRQSSRAIVDGRLVGVGDTIAAGKIIAIQAGGVLVLRGEKRILFKLRPR